MADISTEMRDRIEGCGWSIYACEDGSIELEQHSPAGEDFSFCIWGEDIAWKVRECAEDFDIEEHVFGLLEAKRNGFAGVPGIKVLVEDAEAIKTMLNELAGALEEVVT